MKIFNPTGDDRLENRQLWGGNPTNLMNLNSVRYPWAVKLYSQMREQFWIPQKYDLTTDVTDYGNLTEDERRGFDGILSYLTFLDSIQTVNLPYLRSLITAPEVGLCLTEQTSQECFDDRTKILTPTGWKYFADIDDDLVAQYNIDDRSITFAKPLRVIKKHFNGNLVEFKSDQTSICVTPNHELIATHPSTHKTSKRLAKDIKGGNYKYPKTGKFVGGTAQNSNVFNKLLIAIAADGSIREFVKTSNYTTNVQIEITKQRKINRLEKQLHQLEIEFTKTRKDPGWKYSFTLPVFIPKAEIKSLGFINPFILSKASAQALLEECLFWDGNQKNAFYSTNLETIDKVQLIAMVAEQNATIGINRTAEQAKETILPNGENPKQTKNCYVVTISECHDKTYPTPKALHYEGMVYCVTVPTGNIVTQRDGKIAITGNCLHSASYQYIIETLVPSERRNDIYEYWREDKVLLARCKEIAQYYQQFQDTGSLEDYFYALVANYLLEGLYFYNGFVFFYSLASRQLMSGTADVIKTINRDELSHVRLFQFLVKEAMASKVFTFSVDRILEMVNSAVKQESGWSLHILQDNVLGISASSTEQYTKWLANQRLKAVGLEPLYSGEMKNPYAHLEKMADTSKNATTKANFFEATVTGYSMSESVEGWDEF